MQTEILVAVLSLAGTLLGSLFGILAANRLTVYRLEQLEKKVEKHNSLSDRIIVCEQSCKSAHKRIDKIEEVVFNES